MAKPEFFKFLKMGSVMVSRHHSVYARRHWMKNASKTMKRKPGCIASAGCFLKINGVTRMMLFTAHTREGGYVRWSVLGDRKVTLPKVHTLTPTHAANVHGKSFMRDGDAEFLLLDYIADSWTPAQLTGGYIVMHIEYPPCSSCAAVIKQFKGIYKDVDVQVQW